MLHEKLNGSTFGQLRSTGLYDLKPDENGSGYFVNMARPMLHAMQVKEENIETNEDAGRPIEISWSTQDTYGKAMEKSQLYGFVASARSLKTRIEDAQTKDVKGKFGLLGWSLGMATFIFFFLISLLIFTLIISFLQISSGA